MSGASDLNDLAADLLRAAETVPDRAERVVSRGALNIKRDARARISGHPRHLPHYPSSITYDIDRAGSSVTASIGPDKDLTQGPLGNLIEYGSVNNAPIPHLAPAHDAEEPRFVAAAGDLGEQLLDAS